MVHFDLYADDKDFAEARTGRRVDRLDKMRADSGERCDAGAIFAHQRRRRFYLLFINFPFFPTLDRLCRCRVLGISFSKLGTVGSLLHRWVVSRPTLFTGVPRDASTCHVQDCGPLAAAR